MGVEQSSEQGEDFLKNFQSQYSFLKEISDQRFGDIQIYRENGTENMVFLKNHWCQSEEDYHQFIRYCNQRINNPQKNIIRLVGYTQSSENQLCGDFSKITGYYEYYSHNLERELDRRHTRNEYFTEPEVWFLLDAIVGVGAYFESQSKVHGDIRPQNVLLTNEGFVKLADPQLVRSDKNAYVKALQFGEQSYLSPQQMKALGNREIQPHHNQFKSDVFSLGMTLLEACNLYSARSCYDYGQYQVIRAVIDDLIQRARARYSSFLVSVLSELVSEEEGQRPSFSELNQLLLPYQEQIQNLQQFTPQGQMFQQQPQQTSQPQQSQQIYQQPQVYQQPQSQPHQSQYIQQQPQQVGQQSQVIYQQQPYITSPSRSQPQQYPQTIQGSQVLQHNPQQLQGSQTLSQYPVQQQQTHIRPLEQTQTHYPQQIPGQQVSYIQSQPQSYVTSTYHPQHTQQTTSSPQTQYHQQGYPSQQPTSQYYTPSQQTYTTTYQQQPQY